MLNISKNKESLNLFLQIINTYGMFLKHREIVKSINENLSFNKLNSELMCHSSDPYSWQAREYGFVSGLTVSNIEEIKEAAVSDIAEENKKIVLSLISTEKYYKKLKHQFVDKFPELKEEMESELKAHINYVENKKRLKNATLNKIISLSERFIAFYQYSFESGNGLHLAYSSFTDYILRKYNIEIEKEYLERVIDKKYSFHNNSNACKEKMSLNEIEFLNSILENLINVIKEKDIEEIENYVDSAKKDKEKKEISLNIVKTEFKRFKKLNQDYKELIKIYYDI